MALLFLLSHQRSGSHFLKQTLNCHNDYLDRTGERGPRYFGIGEIYTHGYSHLCPGLHRWLFESVLNERLIASPSEWGNPEGIAKAAGLVIAELSKLAENYIALADVKLNQLHLGNGWYHDPGAVPKLLYDMVNRGQIIFLQRRNLLRAVLSSFVARQTRVWHRDGVQEVIPIRSKVLIDVERFVLQLSELQKSIEQVAGWLKFLGTNLLLVHYEDLFDAKSLTCQAKEFDRIAKFAGLKTGLDWQSSFQKLGSENLADVIENYDEFRAKIRTTKFATYLDKTVATRFFLRAAA